MLMLFSISTSGGLARRRYHKGSVLSATAASVHTPGVDTRDVIRISIGDTGTFNPPGYLCDAQYTGCEVVHGFCRTGEEHKIRFWYARRRFLSSAEFVEVDETSGEDTFDGVHASHCAYTYLKMSPGGVDQPMGYYANDEVGRCRLLVSKPVLKAPMVSALATIIFSTAFKFCFQIQLAS